MENFAKLVKKISPKLRRIAHKLDYLRAFFGWEDLYQEALIHLWDEFNSAALEGKTDSYILQGCYFHLKNYIRKESDKVKVLSLDAGFNPDRENDSACELPIEDRSAGDALLRLDDRLLTQTILNNGLTDKEKYLLSLCAQGLTTREAGKMIGVSHVSIIKSLKIIRQKCLKYRDNF